MPDPNKPDMNSPDFDPFADAEDLGDETLDLETEELEPDEAVTQIGKRSAPANPAGEEEDAAIISTGDEPMQVGEPILEPLDMGEPEGEPDDEFEGEPMPMGNPIQGASDPESGEEPMQVGRPIMGSPETEPEPVEEVMQVGKPVKTNDGPAVAPVIMPTPSRVEPRAEVPKKKSLLLPVGIAVAVLALAGIAFGAWSMFAGGDEPVVKNTPEAPAPSAPGPNQPAPSPLATTPAPPQPTLPAATATVPDTLATLPPEKQQEVFAGLLQQAFSGGNSPESAAAIRTAREKATDAGVKTRLSLLEEFLTSPIDNLTPPPRPASRVKAPETPETPTETPAPAEAPNNTNAALPPTIYLFVAALIGQQQLAAPANLGADLQQTWTETQQVFENEQSDVATRALAGWKLAGMAYEAGDFSAGESICAQSLALCQKLPPDQVALAATPLWTRLVNDLQQLRMKNRIGRQEASLDELRDNLSTRVDQARADATVAAMALKTLGETLTTTSQELATTKKALTDSAADAKKQLETVNAELVKATKDSKELKDQIDALARDLPVQSMRASAKGYFDKLDVAGRWEKLKPKEHAGASDAEKADFQKRLAEWEQRRATLEQVQADLAENRLTSSAELAAAQFKLQEIFQLAVLGEQPRPNVAAIAATPGSTSPPPATGDLLARLDRMQAALRGESSEQTAAVRKDLTALVARLRADQSAQLAAAQGAQQSQLKQLKQELEADIAKAVAQPHPLPDSQVALLAQSLVGSILTRMEEYGFVSPARRSSIVPAGGASMPRNPAHAQECFSAGYHLYFSNTGADLAEAGRLFGQAVEADPYSATYRYFLGLTLYRQGQHAPALAQVRAGADLEGRSDYERESIASALERVQGPSRAWLDRVRSEI